MVSINARVFICKYATALDTQITNINDRAVRCAQVCTHPRIGMPEEYDGLARKARALERIEPEAQLLKGITAGGANNEVSSHGLRR